MLILSYMYIHSGIVLIAWSRAVLFIKNQSSFLSLSIQYGIQPYFIL